MSKEKLNLDYLLERYRLDKMSVDDDLPIYFDFWSEIADLFHYRLFGYTGLISAMFIRNDYPHQTTLDLTFDDGIRILELVGHLE